MNTRKSKIINIEWMFVDKNPYDLIMEDIRQAATEKCNTIIFVALLDGFYAWNPLIWVPMLEKIEEESNKLGIEELVFISGAGRTYEYGLKHKHYFYDNSMSVVKNAYKPHLTKIADYSVDQDKFIFLTGRPARPNRIGLLSKIYDADLLKHGVWSFFPPWNNVDAEWCRQYLKRYNDIEYANFISFCTKSLDKNNEYEQCKTFLGVYEGNKWHDIVKQPYIQNPSFMDISLYNNVKLSVVSEGPIYWEWCSDRFYLTDKTYREILMKKPIIIAGYVEQYQCLKDMGFKTFDDYFLIKDYGLIPDEEERLDAIVKNIEYFMQHSSETFEKIKKDVDFNYKLLYSYFNSQDNFLIYLRAKYNLSKAEVDKFFTQQGLTRLIQVPK